MYHVYCAATGEPLPSELPNNNNNNNEEVLQLDDTKKIIPFHLCSLDGNTQFFYQAGKFAVETNTPLYSQPATLDSLVNHTNFLDVQNIYERLNLIVNQAKEICQVTEGRFDGCENQKNKRSIIQEAKDTLVSYVKDKTFKNYCDLIEEQANYFSSNSQYVNDLSFESIKDELVQTKTVNNCDLMTALKLDDKTVSNLITTVKSQQQMISMNQSKTYIIDQLNEISGRDDDQVEELALLNEKMQSLIDQQREKIQTLLSDYESVKLTNDDLQFYNFEYHAKNLYEEILTIENNTRDVQSIYLLKDHAFRVLLNQQMLKVCERATLILLMMKFFNRSKEGGALEKLVFLSKLPDINRQLMNEIDNRRENFAENVLIKNFRNFTESVKQACDQENERRANIENNAINGLKEIQLQELKSIIPGIVGERIPINLIIEGLAKLERSISRTIDTHLPQSNSKDSDEENDFILISKPSENLNQSTHDLSKMTMSALIDYTDRKTEALPGLIYQNNVDNELVDESVPTQLLQSVVVQSSDDHSQLQNTILCLKQEVESLHEKLNENAAQLLTRKHTIDNQLEMIEQMEEQAARSEEIIEQLKNDMDEKQQAIQLLDMNIEELTSRIEQGEREKLLSSDVHSDSVSQLQVAMSQLELSKKDLQEKFIKMASEFSKMDNSSKAKDEQIISLTNSLQQYECRLENLQHSLDSQIEKHEQQCMDMMLSERNSETLEKENKSLSQEVDDCRNELNVIKEERILVERNLRNKVDQLTQAHDELAKSNTELVERISELSSNLDSTVDKMESVSQQLFTQQQNTKENDLKLQVAEQTKEVLQQKLSMSEERSTLALEKIARLSSELEISKQLLIQEASKPVVPQPVVTTDNEEKLRKEVKELTIKAKMYEDATLRSAMSVTTLQKKIQEQQLALKEQEATLKFIQEQYSQLEMQTQNDKQLLNQPLKSGKTYVSLEPELNDIVIFFKGGNKDIFTAISKNSNRIIIAPESIGTLKERYGDAFDKLNIVVGRIVYLEQSTPSFNPFNLNTPYSTAFIEELL